MSDFRYAGILHPVNPLIRIKSSYDGMTREAKTLFDVYDCSDSPTTTIAKGEFVIAADSAEHGELAAIHAALGAISTEFDGVEIQSDLENIRNWLLRWNDPKTHEGLRSAILSALIGKTVSSNPFPESTASTYTAVAGR